MPLVSVLTPCFNSARFIENCIQSVLSQDYSEIEFIVQDGGSTDGTVEILKKYSDRISWASEKIKANPMA
jgi:glycosyltransferase involved in cell wall biosynthesis